MGEDHEGQGPSVKSLVDEVSRMVEMELDKIGFPSEWDCFPQYVRMPFECDPRWHSLHLLVQCEWLTRGWVVREAALAQQGQVLRGRSEIDWWSMLLTLFWLLRRAPSIAAQTGNIQDLTRIHLETFVDRHITRLRCFVRSVGWCRSTLLDYPAYGRSLRMTDPDECQRRHTACRVGRSYASSILRLCLQTRRTRYRLIQGTATLIKRSTTTLQFSMCA